MKKQMGGQWILSGHKLMKLKKLSGLKGLHATSYVPMIFLSSYNGL